MIALALIVFGIAAFIGPVMAVLASEDVVLPSGWWLIPMLALSLGLLIAVLS